MTSANHTDSRKPTLNCVETVFEILETVHTYGEVTLTELAEELDMPRSTLHAYLKTMVQNEYLVRDELRYRLSFKFLGHGSKIRSENDLYRVGKPALRQMADRTDEIAWIVVEEYGMGVYLDKAMGELAVQPYGKTGSRVHLHNIAAGKAILSRLSETRVREIAETHGLPASTDHTITDVETLLAELSDISERGVAFADEESIEGFRAVASPVCPQGELHGSIVVSGPKNRLKGSRFRETLPQIVSGTANAIELELMAE